MAAIAADIVYIRLLFISVNIVWFVKIPRRYSKECACNLEISKIVFTFALLSARRDYK